MDPWSRGRDVARGVRRSSSKPEENKSSLVVFAIGERSRIFVVCFVDTIGQMFLTQMPDRRPPRITGRVVNTVVREWVGAPNERAPFSFHDSAAGFVDRCLSGTRNLAASKQTFG